MDDFGQSGGSEAGEAELELETVNNAQAGSDPRNVNGTCAGSDAGAQAGSAAGSNDFEEMIPGLDVMLKSTIMNLTLNLRISMKMLLAGIRFQMWIRSSVHQKWEHAMVWKLMTLLTRISNASLQNLVHYYFLIISPVTDTTTI